MAEMLRWNIGDGSEVKLVDACIKLGSHGYPIAIPSRNADLYCDASYCMYK
jgi:hypothetical protein